MNYEIIQMDEQTWRIEEGGVRFFLLAGTKEALLIDSGMEVHNAREIAQSLVDLPVRLLNTHGDRDHVGSNGQFEAAMMHPAECSNYYKTQGQQGRILPVWEGDVIDLGDRPLEILALPGHTPGSIAVLDRNRRVLISGDPVQDGMIFMFGIQREAHGYLHSLEKLDACKDRFDQIWPSHGSFPVKPSLIRELREGMEGILKGEILPEEGEMFGVKIRKYHVGAAVFLMDD